MVRKTRWLAVVWNLGSIAVRTVRIQPIKEETSATLATIPSYRCTFWYVYLCVTRDGGETEGGNALTAMQHERCEYHAHRVRSLEMYAALTLQRALLQACPQSTRHSVR